MTESLVTLLVSSIVLAGFYQLTFGSVAFFTKNKTESDAIETKTPSIELLARYFDRWGVGVITDPASSNEKKLPKTDKYIYMPQDSSNNPISATSSNPIIFFANLSGFGFVKSLSGSTANLLSCRLGDDLTTGNSCYYVLRNNEIIPKNLNTDNDSTSGGELGLDSVHFNTSFSFKTNGKECVDKDFVSDSANGLGSTNSTIGKTGTIKDFNSSAISSLISSLIPIASSTFDLEEGDIIFRTPHRVELYIAQNSDDKNKNWLYAKLTPLASSCINSSSTLQKPQPIAPANSIKARPPKKADNSSNLGGVEIEVEFRGEPYKGQEKKYIVTRVFGG